MLVLLVTTSPLLVRWPDNFSNSSGLVVHFLEGTHLLNLQDLVVFTNLTNAVFEGDGRMEQGFHETVWQSTVVIKCTEHSRTGIAFVNSANITFRYITITNCSGADMPESTHCFVVITLGNASLWVSLVLAIVSLLITFQFRMGQGCGLLIKTDLELIFQLLKFLICTIMAVLSYPKHANSQC